MADAQQAVTAWDEQGNPVKSPAPAGGGAAAWDEHGNPIPTTLENPPNPKTGEGMENYALQQAHSMFTPNQVVGQTGGGQPIYDKPPNPIDTAAAEHTANQVRLSAAENRALRSPTPVTDASMALFPASGIGESIATKGLGPTLSAAAKPVARTVVGAAGGAAAGGYGGRQIGGMFGKGGAETGGQIGATVGGLAGGFFGGMRGEPVEPPLGSPENPGLYSKIPTGRGSMPKVGPADWAEGPRYPKGGLPAGPTEFESGGIGGGTVARPSRTMVLTPSEARSEAQMQQLATRRASERGMQFAGGMVPREGRSVPYRPTVIGPVEEYGGPRQAAPTGPTAPITENRRVAPGASPTGMERRRPLPGPTLPHEVGNGEELARLQAQLKTHPEDAAKIQRAIDDLRHHNQ